MEKNQLDFLRLFKKKKLLTLYFVVLLLLLNFAHRYPIHFFLRYSVFFYLFRTLTNLYESMQGLFCFVLIQ